MSIKKENSARVVDYIYMSAVLGLYFLKKIAREFWTASQEIAQYYHEQRLEEGCECCGNTVACEVCYRCSSWNCNGGCIFCVNSRRDRFQRRGGNPAG